VTYILVRKLLRDVRTPLVVVCLILFLFATLWVVITQRVTTEVAPMFKVVSKVAVGDAKAFEKVLLRGPTKVSQAALGWGELNFDRPNDFLSIGLLHPAVLVLSLVWGVGRAAGAVAGELDRGTMELLLSQPVPRHRLIVAHFLVDCVALPVLCLAFFAGTQFGLATVPPFEPNFAALDDLANAAPPVEKDPFLKLIDPSKRFKAAIARAKTEAQPLEVDGTRELIGLVNTLALMFAFSGTTMALSALGRNRWRVIALAVLIAFVMFVANTVGQLWEPAAWARPLTFFFYYQPQKAMLDGQWGADVGTAWGGSPLFVNAAVVLFAAGAIGYAVALRAFVKRDLPAPL
jgi:ABC-2 type transport system permease protein